MRKRKIVIGLVISCLTMLGTAWLFGWFSGNPALGEVQQLQAQLADPNLKDDARRALLDQMRAKLNSLSPDARRAMWDNNREIFENRMLSHMKDILAMSTAEQAKALDADIDRMEKARAQMQANAQSNAATTNAQNSARRQGNRGQALSDDQRISRLRNRLDRSTPEMRAVRNAYTQLVNQRRQQRGLPPLTAGRPVR
ncbi:MAG TPA: hypothetical protein VFE46_16090 [Pirellulales bacterium]|nr:hypothetical protein [Pirellulales bacterium]